MQSRYLTDFIKKDLRKKMVLLSGPRQCGKTTLAKSLLGDQSMYLNWDIPRDRLTITRRSWPADTEILVLDELHKNRSWKNFLKGLFDEYGSSTQILVTGSARLETFRKAGDALTGRYFHYRLHPIDIAEGRQFFPNLSPADLCQMLLSSGGFPESFLNPDDAPRLMQNRFDQVVDSDLRDLSQIRDIAGVSTLIELLRERVGGTISYASLGRDIGVSPPTIKSWIEMLERLFIVFIVRPWTKGLARSIRKEPKIYFYDCAAPLEPGARLENLVACALLKHIHLSNDTKGQRYALSFVRDRDDNEIDFVVSNGTKVRWAIEVKSSETNPGKGLVNILPRLKADQGIQLVQRCHRRERLGLVDIEPLAAWLEQMPHLLNKN